MFVKSLNIWEQFGKPAIIIWISVNICKLHFTSLFDLALTNCTVMRRSHGDMTSPPRFFFNERCVTQHGDRQTFTDSHQHHDSFLLWCDGFHSRREVNFSGLHAEFPSTSCESVGPGSRDLRQSGLGHNAVSSFRGSLLATNTCPCRGFSWGPRGRSSLRAARTEPP